MANTLYFLLLLLLLLLSAFSTATAQQRQFNISPGSSLTPGSNLSWLSPSGLYAFGFHPQRNGYAVGIFLAGGAERTVVWTANRDDPPVFKNATLLLTTDGKLVLQPMQGQETPVVSLDEPASSASMLDSGNFVLYNSDQKVIWQSFEHPTDTLLPGQPLGKGQELFSSISQTDHSTGIFRLQMQADANLVQHAFKSNSLYLPEDSYWFSDTKDLGDNVTLNLDADGHLYLLNSNFILKNLTKEGNFQRRTIYLMKLDVDGIFRVYSQNLDEKRNWTIVWSSTEDKCDPKGLCGLNGFCVPRNVEAQCKCVPGFSFVDPKKWSSGCEWNYKAGSCKNDDGRMNYTMKTLDETTWFDNSYTFLGKTTKEDCSAACQVDDNCDAAMFEEGDCRLLSLPLKYGRRKIGSSSFAFFKEGACIRNGIQADPHKEGNKKLAIGILIICVSLVAFAFIVLAISGALIYRSNARAYKKVSEKGDIEISEGLAPPAFTYAELEDMTNSFKEELGRGSFGAVYKGTIQNTQKVVAVKRLEKVLAEGEREFQSEMKVIARTHHRNLVKLYGYCVEGTKRLLMYEYMSNGSLADILFTSQNQLSWDERIGISLGIARGILYLHEECETQIVHCDIKPQNILMDECRQLSKLVGDEQVDERKLNRMVKVALWCIQDEPSLRPSMRKVLLMLEGTVDIPVPPSPTSFLSTV
ncbi:hypothetical protein RJ639_015781 [Escallonia herrerae]|uniref:non-specific serine/threonine protein kinase n=1 Tax=Escallonia herrerae TaxID=1293975 RepID=A0AA88VDW0_9ASTE|nr:hypothetical protein RJ639_015781 [Escallonia herrerae]